MQSKTEKTVRFRSPTSKLLLIIHEICETNSTNKRQRDSHEWESGARYWKVSDIQAVKYSNVYCNLKSGFPPLPCPVGLSRHKKSSWHSGQGQKQTFVAYFATVRVVSQQKMEVEEVADSGFDQGFSSESASSYSSSSSAVKIKWLDPASLGKRWKSDLVIFVVSDCIINGKRKIQSVRGTESHSL